MKPRFQIRLRTAIVLMIAASVLLWLNFRGRCEPIPAVELGSGLVWDSEFYFAEWQRGWPSTMNRGVRGHPMTTFSRFDYRGTRTPVAFKKQPEPPYGLEGRWEIGEVFSNLCFSFLVLSGLYLCCTALDRREEARKK